MGGWSTTTSRMARSPVMSPRWHEPAASPDARAKTALAANRGQRAVFGHRLALAGGDLRRRLSAVWVRRHRLARVVGPIPLSGAAVGLVARGAIGVRRGW